MRTEIQKFADTADRRRVVEFFLDWLDAEGIELRTREGAPVIERRDLLVCRYFDIDAARLESERRALLDAERERVLDSMAAELARRGG